MELELTIMRNCNNACMFCLHPRPREYQDPPLDSILARIDESDPEEIDTISLTGGEPLLRRELFFIIDYARIRHRRARVRIVTNGRLLANQNLVRELARRRVEIITEIHAPTPEEHDALTRSPGSYHETVTGIKNCLEHNIKVEVRIVVHGKNHHLVPGIVGHINKRLPGVKGIVIFPILYSGEARKNMESLAVSYTEMVPHTERVLAGWQKGDIPIRLYHTPLCVISPRYWRHVEGRTAREPRIRETSACGSCLLRKECALPWATYVLRHGEKEFSPITDPSLVRHFRNERAEWEKLRPS